MRKGFWTEKEEKILRETVEKFAAEGKTKTAAFEHAAMKLGRTSSACRYRYNSVILKNKKETAILQLPPPKETVPELTMDKVISFLQRLKEENDIGAAAENAKLKKELADLKKHSSNLLKEYETKMEQFEQMRAKYLMLANIIEEAKGMIN